MRFRIRTNILLLMLLLLGLGVVLALNQALTITPVTPNPNNATNYTGAYGVTLNISVSPDNNASVCSYDFGFTNNTVTTAFVTNMTNSTSNSFHNASAVGIPDDSALNGWHNVTFRCYNGSDWYNETVLFGLDSTNPSIDNINYNISNQTSGGHSVNYTFNVTDRHTRMCGVRIYDPWGEMTNVTGTLLDGSNVEDGRCDVDISSSEFSFNGNYTLEPWAQDYLDLNGTGTNLSVNVYKLAVGWNHVSISDNVTLSSIANNMTNVSYVSVYDNLYKNYTTFTTGSSTNANFRTNSTNATYIYVSENVTMIRVYHTDNFCRNMSLYKTSTSGWNQMGVRTSVSLNQTMYNSTGPIYKYDNTLNASFTSENITYVSYRNATLGKYCSARRGFTATSCSPEFNVTDIKPARGEAIWILVNENITYDRGA